MPTDFSSFQKYPAHSSAVPANRGSSRSSTGKLALLLGLPALGLAGIVVYVLWKAVSSLPDSPSDLPDFKAPPGVTPFAIITPVTHAAEEVKLGDQEEVIGVTVGGKHRAYLIRAMGGDPTAHIVDDLLGGLPVSVVHCDRTHCTKVFTGDEPGAVLHLTFGGYAYDQLLIRAGGTTYFQETLQPYQPNLRPFPYRENNQFVETTWKEWKKAHPDTDVYIGGQQFSIMRDF